MASFLIRGRIRRRHQTSSRLATSSDTTFASSHWAPESAPRWLLIETQSVKHRRAHLHPAALPFVRPLSELDLRYQFRLYEVNRPRAFHSAEERAVPGLQCVQ